jgi:hypothetical protein
MEKCLEINVGEPMAVKCASITVIAAPPVISLTSVTCPAQCNVGESVTVTVICTNTSQTNGIANLKFTVNGTGTPNPATVSLNVPANGTASTSFTYVPTAATMAGTTQTACAELVSVSSA